MKIDGDVLFGLLKKVCPATYKHLVSKTILSRKDGNCMEWELGSILLNRQYYYSQGGDTSCDMAGAISWIISFNIMATIHWL